MKRKASGAAWFEALEPRRMFAGDSAAGLERSVVWQDRHLPEAVADFTGDGVKDLLLRRRQGSSTSGLFLRKGLGEDANGELRFGQARRVLSAAESRGLYVGVAAVGRFTSGTELDVAMYRRRSDPFDVVDLLLLKNDGRGNFEVASVTPISTHVGPMVAASFGGEGSRQSLVMVVARVKELRAVKFTDDGRMVGSRVMATGRDLWLAYPFDYSPRVGDVDGDGADDVVLTRLGSGGGTMQMIFSRDGGRRFESRVVASVGGDQVPAEARLGDFNGDGLPDLVYTVVDYGRFGDVPAATVQVRFARRVEGGVVFAAAEEVYRREAGFGSAVDMAIMEVGDATGDGRADIVIGVQFELPGVRGTLDLVAVQYSGDAFQEIPPVTLLQVGDPHEPWSISGVFWVSDVDGDGLLDVFRRDDVLELWRMN